MGKLKSSILLLFSGYTLVAPMSLTLETGLPSTRLLQTYLRDKRTVEAKLVTGDTIVGPLSWQDPNCICIDAEGEPVVIWRSALAYIKGI